MAKPFYSIEEVCQKLGKDKNGVTDLVREGRLREFRDAGKVFFKADEVDKLAGGGAAKSDDDVMLESVEETLPSVSDPTGGTSIIGLLPTEDDEPAPAPAMAKAPPPPSKEGTGAGLGVVFEDDEIEIDADPMAKTQITSSAPADRGEGSGGGSGLLELTRESDDTSLGAELLDEIYPGEDEAAAKKPAAAADEAEEAEEAHEAAYEAAPAPEPLVAYSAGGDPAEGMMSGLLVGALILMTLAGSVAASAAQGFFPDYGRFLSDRFLFFLGGAVLVPVIALLIGWLVGKAGAPRRTV